MGFNCNIVIDIFNFVYFKNSDHNGQLLNICSSSDKPENLK